VRPRDAISGALLRALVTGADIGCGGALRFVRGAEAILEAVERGIVRRQRQIPSLQGFRTLRGARGAHHGESLAEDAYLTDLARRSRTRGGW